MTDHPTHGAQARRWGVVLPGVLLVIAAGAGTAAAADDPEEYEPFTVSGSVTTALLPGQGGPLDLRLTNPNAGDLTVSDLTVTISGVDPGSAAGCSIADFAVVQYDGTDLVLPGSSTRALSELGLTVTQMPQLRMLETGLNQDGCQGGNVRLAYAGAAGGAEVGPAVLPPPDPDPNPGSNPGSDLPSTGGNGHGLELLLAGLGLIAAGAGAVSVTRRRVRA